MKLDIVPSRKRQRHNENDRYRLLPKPISDVQHSFVTNYNKDFDIQGQVGACHTFATLELIHDVTNGMKLSKERLFLDHMMASGSLHFGSVDDLVDYNLREIQRVRTLKGSAKCADSIFWEGGSDIYNIRVACKKFEFIEKIWRDCCAKQQQLVSSRRNYGENQSSSTKSHICKTF